MRKGWSRHFWYPQQRFNTAFGCLLITYAIRYAVLLLVFITASTFAQASDSSKQYQLDIPAQIVEDALQRLAKQTGKQLLFSHQTVDTLTSKAVKGRYSLQQALQQMLIGTGLSADQTDSGVIVVTSVNQRSNRDRRGIDMNSKKNLLAATVAFFVGVGGVQGVAAEEIGVSSVDGRLLEEVIVTASKRGVQSINDTALSISAVGAGEIARRGLVNSDDFLDSLPGVSFIAQGPGLNSPIIRGVSVNANFDGGNTSAPTGAYFGEVPITSLGVVGTSSEIKLVDIERVEVLRGPQGTLYGSASLGGVVRYIPTAPDLEQFEGSFTSEYSKTAEGGDDNTHLEGVLNFPLIEDQLALRVVAYHIDDSGYYNNVAASDPFTAGVTALGGIALDSDNIGEVTTNGSRSTLLWKPTEDLSVQVSYLFQEIEEDGRGQVDIGTTVGDQFSQRRPGLVLAADTQTNPVSSFTDPGNPESLTDKLQIYNLVVEYDLGWATILSSTSHSKEEVQRDLDLTAVLGGTPISQTVIGDSKGFVQEIRFNSKFEGPFQLLVGGFYEDIERFSGNSVPFSGDPTLNPFGTDILLLANDEQRNFEQIAVFGELSYDLSDQLKVILGGRYFDFTSEFNFDNFPGAFQAPSSVDIENSDDGTSLKASLEYRPDEDTLIYGTFSEGFRLGFTAAPTSLPASLCDVDGDGFFDGSNGIPFGVANEIENDILQSYEAGAKFGLADGRMQINVAAFYLNWDDIPLSVAFDTGCGAIDNAGSAQSQGVEVETAFAVTDTLTLGLTGSYIDAELTEDAPSIGGFDGDRLPGSPEYNMSANLQQTFQLFGNEAYANINYAYIGGFRSTIPATREETGPEAGGYGLLGISAGVDLSDALTLLMTADNLTNEDDFTFIGVVVPGAAYRLRPRTIGMRVNYRF